MSEQVTQDNNEQIEQIPEVEENLEQENQGEMDALEEEKTVTFTPANKPPRPDTKANRLTPMQLEKLKENFSPVQLKHTLNKSQFKDMMKPLSTLNTPSKANNKFIVPTINQRADKIFQAPIHTVGNRTTLSLTDRFHSREDPHTYVNWSRRTYDIAPNSYKSDYYNTLEHAMHNHKSHVIMGDKTRRYKTSNYSFSDVGKDNESITTPKHPQHFSKDQQTTTEWQKDTNKIKEVDYRKTNGQQNSTITKKPDTVQSWRGGTVNSKFIKDISKFSSLKLKQK